MAQNGSDAKRPKLADELAMFDEVFPMLMNDLEKHGVRDPETSGAVAWFKRAALYNVPHGKKNRGISVVQTYRHLVEDPTEENLKIARVLGWGVEFLQAYFLVADDIMDQSITRRGQPCWYKQEDVSLTAINDSFFLESTIYQMLKKYIREQPYYVNVLELFLEVNYQTVTGQCLDMTTALPEGNVDFTQFTMERYSAIVKWKTAFYSFYLPVALAMHMAGISDDDSHSRAKNILLQMGHFFQVQDDYLDCYGKPEVIGKIGTDIEDNKCGWLIVKALEIASKEQIEILKANYARKDELCVQKVKAVYKELDLEGVYRKYEDDSYRDLIKLINETSGNLPKDIFIDFAKKIFKREK
ncbi:farnesyl pyrophosphate synthase isoform X2 [Aplysia californica]|nr:farnesyl pyrophosphate synthase isoform X2 [Aplysia californica]